MERSHYFYCAPSSVLLPHKLWTLTKFSHCKFYPFCPLHNRGLRLAKRKTIIHLSTVVPLLLLLLRPLRLPSTVCRSIQCSAIQCYTVLCELYDLASAFNSFFWPLCKFARGGLSVGKSLIQAILIIGLGRFTFLPFLMVDMKFTLAKNLI